MPLRIPRYVWGVGDANTTNFVLPLHTPMPLRAWKGEHLDAPNGLIDAAREALFYELEYIHRRIPAASWGGATGVAALLDYLRDGNHVKLYLDITDLVGSLHNIVAVEVEESRENMKAQFYSVRMRVRDVDGHEFVI